MVIIQPIHEIRPRFSAEFGLSTFEPRTPAIADALHWGSELHAGQKRMSGEPYFETHCVWIANFIDRLVHNEAWTIAALLHDSVEDRGGSLEQIKDRFPGTLGEEVAYVVDGVTKLSTPREGRSREMETLRKIAMFRDPGVFLVKLADKSHNIMTLQHMPEAKRRQKAEEAIRAYGRLAGILNCYVWRRWLEDMAFPYAYPEIFQSVREKIDCDPRLSPDFINATLRQLGDIMERAGVDGAIEITVNGYWQSWRKLKRMVQMRKTSLNTFSGVNDLASFRMVVDANRPELCYDLLAGVNRYLGVYLDQDRFDDYIACPQNGYQALQVTAWLPDFGAVEVAIATREMEEENRWGVVYALNNGRPIDTYRTVEILTPTGGVRFVPEGSSVLDAVAAIQQDMLLERISAVKVNNNLARLSDKVNPGDVIEVVTTGHRMTPSEEWLSYCNRSTASLLRSVLVTESLKRAAEIGRREVKNLLAGRGFLTLEDVLSVEPDKSDLLLSLTAVASLEDLYAAVGGGAILPEDLHKVMDEIGFTKSGLNLSTVSLVGSQEANRPGILAFLAGMVAKEGGNIMHMVQDTLPDGGFMTRFLVKGLTTEIEERLRQDYADCHVPLTSIVVV
jgi:GTP diphosphokinase / guanosine-3',5'-bis(diphosphate) 3'-diphosphatase